MITKKLALTHAGHHIEFCIVFNPFRLASHETLSVDGQVIAKSDPSRNRVQSRLTEDYAFKGVTQHIVATSAPMKGGLKQGLQVYIDGQFIGGDKELVIAETKESNHSQSEAVQKKSGIRSFSIIKVYGVILLMFLLATIRSEGTGFTHYVH